MARSFALSVTVNLILSRAHPGKPVYQPNTQNRTSGKSLISKRPSEGSRVHDVVDKSVIGGELCASVNLKRCETEDTFLRQRGL